MRFLTPTWPAQRANALDLFDEMERLFTEINTAPNRKALERSFNPAVDVEETDKGFLMTFDIPGIKSEDIKIEMNENILTVSGERHRTQKFDDGTKAQRLERSYGSFSRSFTLPTNVASDEIEAHYEDGVLQLHLPKTQLTKSRKIEIQAGKKKIEDSSTNAPH